MRAACQHERLIVGGTPNNCTLSFRVSFIQTSFTVHYSRDVNSVNMWSSRDESNLYIHVRKQLYLTMVRVKRSNFHLFIVYYLYGVVRSEVGTCNFFLSPQSQFRNLKEALPQSQFRNLLRNVAPQPQLRNSAIAIISEIRNFKSATGELHFRNFRNIFRRGVARIIYFFTTRWYLIVRGLKGTVAWDFWPLKIYFEGATIPFRQVSGFHRNRRF